jgi:hypothetical protein
MPMERGEAMGKAGRAEPQRPHRGQSPLNPIRFPGLPLLPTPPPPVYNGDSPWDRLSIQERWGLLRECPIDRTSLPVPIENQHRFELVEALRQIGAMKIGGLAPLAMPQNRGRDADSPSAWMPRITVPDS